MSEETRIEIADPEVVPKAKRRQFSARYKLRILEEAENCGRRGQLGALLRREGLYSSHLTTWRRQREKGQLDGLGAKRRGPKPRDVLEEDLAKLRRENERLKARLERAETIIEVQKNFRACLVWQRTRSGQEETHDPSC